MNATTFPAHVAAATPMSFSGRTANARRPASCLMTGLMNPSSGCDTQGSALFACVSTAWQVHQGELRGYLRHRLADADAADDVLQDVFVKAMRQGQAFCTLINPRAWLFQVARNALVDRLRIAHPTESLADDGAELADPGETMAPVDALADCLTRVVGELASEDAALLRACDLQGQAQRDYAQAHGLSLPATKSRLLRARHKRPCDGRATDKRDEFPPS